MVLGKTRFGGFFFAQRKVHPPVGAAAGCDLLILILKTRSKDRSLRQLLQG
jgi:hypothetical protein